MFLFVLLACVVDGKLPDGVDTAAEPAPPDLTGADCASPVLSTEDVTLSGAAADEDAAALCAGGYVSVFATVTVEDTDWADLSALACLCEARSLVVSDNGDLVSLGGTALTDLGSLKVSGSPLLSSLRGLPPVAEYDEVFLEDLPVLASLEGLAGVETIHGQLWLYDTPALGSLAGLDALRSVGSLYVKRAGLTTLDALGALEAASVITLDEVDGLRDFQGIGPLAYLDRLYLYDVGVESLAGLESLTGVGSLTVGFAPSLVTLSGLDNLAVVDGGLVVSRNAALVSMALPALATVRGGVTVYGNPLLTDVELPALTTAGAVSITEQPALVSLDGLASLTHAEALVVEDNPALASVAGLGALRTVEGIVQLRDNDALVTLDSLALEEAGTLALVGNDALEDLDGLDRLRALATDLRVIGNPALADVAGLAALERVDRDVVISGNPALSTVAAEGLVESIPSIGGEVRIEENGP